jgi:hypothetical protein
MRSQQLVPSAPAQSCKNRQAGAAVTPPRCTIFQTDNTTTRRETEVTTKNDGGESLVEIVMSLVLLGTVVAALMAGLATAARVSLIHRNSVTADTVMRSYAEQVKNAVRSQCATNTSFQYVLPLTPVDGFTPSQSPAGQDCPTTASNLILTLTVDGKGLTKSMQLEVRRP